MANVRTKAMTGGGESPFQEARRFHLKTLSEPDDLLRRSKRYRLR